MFYQPCSILSQFCQVLFKIQTMQKKRPTRSYLQAEKINSDLFMPDGKSQVKRQNIQQAQNNRQLQKQIQNTKTQKLKKIAKRNQSQPLNDVEQQFVPQKMQIESQILKAPAVVSQSSVTFSKSNNSGLGVKKKKINKKQQNQGIRILQQKQTQKIFQHLCSPEGVITVQSLGRMMVRAKKQFQMQDLENMIAYYETIKQKQNASKGQPNSSLNQQEKKSKRQEQEKAPNKKLKPHLSSVKQDIQMDEMKGNKRRLKQRPFEQQQSQNYDDQLSQSDIGSAQAQQLVQQQEQFIQQLTYDQFKTLKLYFDR